MEARLEAGFLGRVESGIEQLRLQIGGKAASRSEKESATVSQGDAIKLGNEAISKIRLLARTGAPDDKAFWRAVGVGHRIDQTVPSIRNNLAKVVEGVIENQAKALRAGILPSDLDAAREYATVLDESDDAQEGRKAKSGLSTVQVRALLKDLKRDLTHLASVATVSLPANVAAKFSAALPGSGFKKKPAAA